MKQIFERILGINVQFTAKVEDFIKHSGPKITYTKLPLQNEFFIRSNDLLFEQGINDLQIKIHDWEGIPCFFLAGERSSIPFDIFSASFYLLSRYEEYLPHVKDVHDRFPPLESLAYKNKFLQMPVVDIWANKLLIKLKERFPDLKSRENKYTYNSIIDVTTSHCYAHRGIVRSFAGFILDITSFKFKRVLQRISVWFDPEKDPYNNFSWMIDCHKKYKITSLFFFQFADYSTFDKNVSTNNNRFQFLIKQISDYSIVSLCASYSSFHDTDLLKKEKKSLSNVINRPINYSRLRYNRVDIPLTYRNLVEAEFTDDYTMGYTHEIGFRASTSFPFYFYDINLEVQQPIKIHPFAVHDYALNKLKNLEEINTKLDFVYWQVKNVNGRFNTIFSNELLGEQGVVDWKQLYENVLRKYHV
tara:strand:+ start:835 stop:2082 length:1248 start_codon:yes stop_codon:yes gene_type:complete